MRKYYIAAALIAVLAVSSYGLYYFVSKDSVYDQIALNDLSALQGRIQTYVDKNQKAPASLDELNLSPQEKLASRLKNYAYTPKLRVSTDVLYDICTTFKTEKLSSAYSPDESYVSANSAHPKGYYCFNLKSYSNLPAPSTIPNKALPTPTISPKAKPSAAR